MKAENIFDIMVRSYWNISWNRSNRDYYGTIIIGEMGERESEVAGVDVQHIQNKKLGVTPLTECDLSVLHSFHGHMRWFWKRWSAVKWPEWKREGRVKIYPQVSITGQSGENDHNWQNWKNRCCKIQLSNGGKLFDHS